MSLLPVAILAGGLATRLQPLTRDTPKSLLEIAGRPFVLHQLQLLHEQGVEKVVLCVGHLGAQIEALVGREPLPGLTIQYSFDGVQPLGTAGAIRNALPLLGEAFFVLNGDSYLPCPLARMQAAYFEQQRPALMAVLRNESRWGESNVLMKDGELVEYNKGAPLAAMRHIDFGICVLARALFAAPLAAGPTDLADLCHELSLRGELGGFEVSSRFYEIGSLQGIRDTEDFLSQLQAGT